MKNVIRFALLVVMSGVISLVPPSAVAQEQEVADTLAEQQMSQVRTEMQADLDQIDRSLEEIEAQIEEADSVLQNVLTDLRMRQSSLRTEMEMLADLEEDEYTIKRHELEEYYDSLEVDIARARLQATPVRADFQSALQTRLDDFDQKLGEIEQRAMEANEELKADYEERLTELRNEREALGVHYGELEAATDEEFQEMRRSIADEVAAFDASLRKATRHMDRDLEMEHENQ